ncbi:MAG: PEP-CTERM sorting domain-containing protein [Fimbriimonadaceae bacterium]|nr:PEP-CTERM sorting domain-containing protein [Fimbriimonadaceae bacterium]
MRTLLSLALLGTVATSAWAVVFNDALGDVNAPMTTYGNPNVDLASVEITNTASDITFKFTTNSPSITSPDWIKVNAIIRNIGDPTTTGNPWGRPYSLIGGASAFVGGWVDSGGGGQGWNYDGVNWNNNAATSLTISGPSVSYTFNLSALGLAVGDTFFFDATTTGGGGNDSAWDPLSQSTGQIIAPDQPTELASQLTYHVVPEPASMVALGLGVASLIRRRKKA